MPEVYPRPRIAYLKNRFPAQSDGLVARQLGLMDRYDPLVLALCAGAPAVELAVETRLLSGQGTVAQATNRLAYWLGQPYPFFDGEVRREGCVIIHAHSASEASSGLRLKARTHLPLVASLGGPDTAHLLRQDPRTSTRLFAEGDLFLADSDSTRKALLAAGCPDDRLFVLHPGIDLDEIPFAERRLGADGTVNVLMAGRLVERMGVPYALQAFANARRYHRQIELTLTIIGDGPARAEAEALAQELGTAGIQFMGAQPREAVLSAMQRAHIFVLPSVTAIDGDCEGIPLSLLEAQAAGLPVVTTWHSGIPEVVSDGHSGFLVSERNAHALAERLRNLVEHPELWESFGRAGRIAMEQRFGLRRRVATLQEYYDALLGAPMNAPQAAGLEDAGGH